MRVCIRPHPWYVPFMVFLVASPKWRRDRRERRGESDVYVTFNFSYMRSQMERNEKGEEEEEGEDWM